MTNIYRISSPADETRTTPRVPSAVPVALPDVDRRQLEHHLRQCERTKQPSPGFLPYVLHHKIASCGDFEAEVPDDVVTGGCLVSFAIDGGPSETGLLIHRARTGAQNGVIPVSSLLGATLIGMKVGQRAPLLCEDGAIVSVSVLEVAAPA